MLTDDEIHEVARKVVEQYKEKLDEKELGAYIAFELGQKLLDKLGYVGKERPALNRAEAHLLRAATAWALSKHGMLTAERLVKLMEDRIELLKDIKEISLKQGVWSEEEVEEMEHGIMEESRLLEEMRRYHPQSRAKLPEYFMEKTHGLVRHKIRLAIGKERAEEYSKTFEKVYTRAGEILPEEMRKYF